MQDAVFQILRDNAAPASALLAIVFEEYGADCFDWDPMVLKMEIEGDFGVELTDTQSNKLQAAITIISSDQFETDWHVFNSCIHSLNGEEFDHDTFYPIDAEQIASAMPEVEMIRNNFLGEGLKFSDEVNAYAGFIFSEYGLFFAPDEFASAIMPILEGEHDASSQEEKKAALAEIYTHKKDKVAEYITQLT